jgi:uncharacterized protein YcbX
MELSGIFIYPVKSLGGISLNETLVEDRGLQFDRRWMLVDEKGDFLTQREWPKMATLKVVLESENLKITAENDALFVPFQATSKEKIKVRIWQSKCEARLYDETVNSWFSDVLQTKCRLVLMPEETKRKVNPIYALRKFEDVVSFADGYPVLLIGENSLEDLNGRLENPLPMNRFRPNLVLKNSEAFAEDNWKTIKIGDAIFHLVKPCARCVITTINQEKGVSDSKEPLKTLAGYRLKKSVTGQKILFGQNLIAENFGARIRLGDKLEIIETKKRKLKL